MPTVTTEDPFVSKYVESDEEEGGELDEAAQEPSKLQGPTQAALGEAALGDPPKKKKKKKKTKKKKLPAEVSGFEENYVEAPLTVDQVKEAEQIYSVNKSFNERIETCIQRYKAKRKFDPFRLSVFDQYLNLGGIRGGQKQFGGGLGLDEDEELDAAEIALRAATDFVDAGMKEDEWYVDFELVAKAFLSHSVPFVIGVYNVEQLKTCCKLVWNFLNYVLYHNVAPEYTDNVKAAVAVTQQAEKELSLISMFGERIPGKFNKACVAIFGGSIMQHETPSPEEIAKAKQLIEKSIGSIGTEEQKQIGLKAEHVKEENIGLIVLEINMPPRGSYKDVLGKMIVKPWVPEGERTPITELGTFELWLEKQALQYAFVDMKIECHIHTLSSGIFYFENVMAIQCSFYTYLESPHQKDEGDGEVYSEIEDSDGGKKQSDAEAATDGKLNEKSGQ